MSKPYLSIPLSTRLEAWKRGDKTKLGGCWHTDSNQGWVWVPDGVQQPSGCWSGGVFKLPGSSTELRWCGDLSSYFRVVGPAHDGLRLNHTGWYVDNFQSETCHGLVLQLPGRNKEPIYLSAVSDPDNRNSAMVAWGEGQWTGDPDEAARWADQLAESYAGSCREEEAKQTAAHAIKEARDRIAAIRLERRALLADTRTSCTLQPRVRQAVLHEMRLLKDESRKLCQRIRKLDNNYWEAVAA